LLGSVFLGTTKQNDAEKQKALEAWERKLNNIIAGTTSNVVSIAKRKKSA